MENKKKDITELDALCGVAQVIEICDSIPKSEIPRRPLDDLKRDFCLMMRLRIGTHVAQATMLAMLIMLLINYVKSLTGSRDDIDAGLVYLGVELVAGGVVVYLQRKKARPLKRILNSLELLNPFVAQYSKFISREK